MAAKGHYILFSHVERLQAEKEGLREALRILYGQVMQGMEAHQILHELRNSPSLAEALNQAEALSATGEGKV